MTVDNGRLAFIPDPWNERVKAGLEGLVSAAADAEKVPVVGKIINVILDNVWPLNKVDPWDAIKDQVMAVVNEAILQKEIEERRLFFKGIRHNLATYTRAVGDERKILMDIALSDMNHLKDELLGSDNTIHLLPLTMSNAVLHLATLKERCIHGDEIFSNHSAARCAELYDTTNSYIKNVSSVYPAWRTWRNDRIRTRCYSDRVGIIWTARGWAHNDLTGENFDDSDSHNNQGNSWWCDTMEQRRFAMMSYRVLDMMSVLDPIFHFAAFLPGHETRAPQALKGMEWLYMGPFRTETLESGHKAVSMGAVTASGIRIAQIVLTMTNNEGIDSIDFHEQVQQPDHRPGLGTPKHFINIAENTTVTGLKMLWGQAALRLLKLQFFFSNGSITEYFGAQGTNPPDIERWFNLSSPWGLTGASIEKTSDGHGVARVLWRFDYGGPMLPGITELPADLSPPET